MGKFSDSIEKNIEVVFSNVNKLVYTVADDLFVAVVMNSPTAPFAKYAKGLLINNWYPAENGFDLTTTSATSYEGMSSLNRISSFASGKAFYKKDGFISLSNSLSYAYRAEYLGWPTTDNPVWTGTVGPYAPIRNSLVMITAKYGAR